MELTIPDEALQSFGCRATWRLGNSLLVYPGDKKKRTGFSPHSAYGKIFEVKWDTDLQNDITRKLVNESMGIFIQLQRLKSADSSKNKAQLLSVSREYRAVIKVCIMELKSAADRQDPYCRQNIEAQVQMFEIIELIWNFCEVMFINTSSSGCLGQLQDWLKIHFLDVDLTTQALLKTPHPKNHAEYWNALYLYIYQGRISEALQLFELSSEASTEEGRLIKHLLHKMPIQGAARNQSITDFDFAWRHWHEECEQHLHSGALNNELSTICQILCGDEEVFLDHRELLQTWYAMLIAKLFYQHPTVQSSDLLAFASFCIDAFGGQAQLEAHDRMLLAALDFDVHQVIAEASSCFNNWWFALHLADLLYHCGQLQTTNVDYSIPLRDFLLTEYAFSLLNHSSLWQVALNYLDHCCENSRVYQDHLVQLIPVETEKKAHKLIKFCDNRNLTDASSRICKRLSHADLQRGRLGSALSWALRSKDVDLANSIAERYLLEYSDCGIINNVDLLDNLGASVLLSGRLTVLGKYREFHTLHMSGDLQQAAALLLSLLTAKETPKMFWMTLLTDAIPLLESHQVVFSTDQTYELMKCVQEFKLLPESAHKLRGHAAKLNPDKLQILEIALLRNLSKAIIKEGSDPNSPFNFTLG